MTRRTKKVNIFNVYLFYNKKCVILYNYPNDLILAIKKNKYEIVQKSPDEKNSEFIIIVKY